MVVLARMAAFIALLVAAVSPAGAEPVRTMQDGLTLQGELKLAPGKKLSDGLVIMIHGTLAHGGMDIMQALQATLAERGFSTLAPTLALGINNRQGMYDCAQPHRHSNASILREIDAWIAWADKSGAARIGLLGHSRGGAQVALYAAEQGDKLAAKLDRIILVAPTTFDTSIAVADYRARYGKDFAAVMAQAEKLVAAGQGSSLMTDTDFMYCPKAQVAAASFVSYHRADGSNDAPSLLGRIKRPVLLILAGAEEVVKNLPEKLQSAAKPPHYTQAVVDGADHFFKDLYAEDLADLVAKSPAR